MSRAFSLLEILIALAILGIVAVSLLSAHALAARAMRRARRTDEIRLALDRAVTAVDVGDLAPGALTNVGAWEVRVTLAAATGRVESGAGWLAVEVFDPAETSFAARALISESRAGFAGNPATNR